MKTPKKKKDKSEKTLVKPKAVSSEEDFFL